MVGNPWTDPDPQPGDFGADLDAIDPRYVEVCPGNPDAKLTIVVGVEDDDAERLQLTAGPIVLAGGLTASPRMREALRHVLGRTLPGWPIERLSVPSIAGAVALAAASLSRPR